MRQKLFKILPLVFIITFVITNSAFGEETVIGNNDEQISSLQWNGYLQTENRFRTKDSGLSWEEYRLDLTAEASIKSKTHFFSELWIRSLGYPEIEHTGDLTSGSRVSPLNLELREAYIDFYALGSKKLDLRIGRQRIAWGVGSNFNPTDNLNPDDIEDIMDFGRHLASDGFKASYYLGEYTITGVFIPTFKPAVLPEGDWGSALIPGVTLPPGLILSEFTDQIIMPENKLSECSTSGLRVGRNLWGFDLSLSYIHGRDDLPIARKITATPGDEPFEVNLASELIYPRHDIAGIDLAGSLGNVGVWVEAAVFFPEKIKMASDFSSFGMGIQETTVLNDDAFVKYLVGADYTFKNGIYMNSQFLHGFFHERGDDLKNYLVFGLECQVLPEKLMIPFGIIIETDNFHKSDSAWIISPGIAFRPVSNAEITFGIRLIDGAADTTFGKLKENDEIFLKVKYAF